MQGGNSIVSSLHERDTGLDSQHDQYFKECRDLCKEIGNKLINLSNNPSAVLKFYLSHHAIGRNLLLALQSLLGGVQGGSPPPSPCPLAQGAMGGDGLSMTPVSPAVHPIPGPFHVRVAESGGELKLNLYPMCKMCDRCSRRWEIFRPDDSGSKDIRTACDKPLEVYLETLNGQVAYMNGDLQVMLADSKMIEGNIGPNGYCDLQTLVNCCIPEQPCNSCKEQLKRNPDQRTVCDKSSCSRGLPYLVLEQKTDSNQQTQQQAAKGPGLLLPMTSGYTSLDKLVVKREGEASKYKQLRPRPMRIVAALVSQQNQNGKVLCVYSNEFTVKTRKTEYDQEKARMEKRGINHEPFCSCKQEAFLMQNAVIPPVQSYAGGAHLFPTLWEQKYPGSANQHSSPHHVNPISRQTHEYTAGTNRFLRESAYNSLDHGQCHGSEYPRKNFEHTDNFVQFKQRFANESGNQMLQQLIHAITKNSAEANQDQNLQTIDDNIDPHQDQYTNHLQLCQKYHENINNHIDNQQQEPINTEGLMKTLSQFLSEFLQTQPDPDEIDEFKRTISIGNGIAAEIPVTEQISDHGEDESEGQENVQGQLDRRGRSQNDIQNTGKYQIEANGNKKNAATFNFRDTTEFSIPYFPSTDLPAPTKTYEDLTNFDMHAIPKQVKTKYQPGSYNFPKFLGQLSQQYRQNQQHSQAQQQKSEEGEEDEQIEAYKQEERLVQVCDHNSFDGLLPSRLSGLLPLQSDLSLSKLLSCVNSETFRNFDQLGMDHNNLENTNRQPALEDTDQEDRKRQLGDQDLSARKRPKNGTSKDA